MGDKLHSIQATDQTREMARALAEVKGRHIYEVLEELVLKEYKKIFKTTNIIAR